jgi:hypothetical protein
MLGYTLIDDERRNTFNATSQEQFALQAIRFVGAHSMNRVSTGGYMVYAFAWKRHFESIESVNEFMMDAMRMKSFGFTSTAIFHN